ncbi:MAG TPA: hypothetical protein VHB54_07360 [Mucilaginibacter sp.]|nr:hypothetical protein [Mucilaginibacter sp.]
MKSTLMYVELKTGQSNRGPAWIGKAFFSKTGRTIYFNGLAFLKGERHGEGNYLERISGDSYWISGLKKDGKDRHWAGGGKIKIAKGVIPEYLKIVGLGKLPSGAFEEVELNNNPPLKEFHSIENRKQSEL